MESEKKSWIKDNWQFVYSIILIILIPLAIAGNTYFIINKNKINMDKELQRKAALAESTFAGMVADLLDDNIALQDKINQLKNISEVSQIIVLKPNDQNFTVIASSKNSDINKEINLLQYTIAWSQKQSIATLVTDSSTKERFWDVITPLVDSQQNQRAIVDMTVSLKDVDQLTHTAYSQSLLVLIITVIIVLLLLINHFRFFEYALLFNRLKEVDQMKDDFISIASHELKTPMAAIKGYLSMIFEGVSGKVDDKAKKNLEKVYANVKRLDSLVNDLLDVSRIEQGRMKFDLKSTDMSSLIKQVVDELKVKADEKNLKIIYEPKPEVNCQIMADPTRIVQVLDNIIGNAIKYTLEGSISIYHQIEDNNLKTFIKDTGVGMSPEARKRLFEKFYRIQNKKTENVPGTGLGLWITREIIHKMKGEIYVDSMENIGTQFTIVFPIVKKENN